MFYPTSGIDQLLASIHPELNDGIYVFSSVPGDSDVGMIEPVATFREREGLTVIVSETKALAANLPVLFRAAWITLRLDTDLYAVGLTAAFSTALGEAGVSCNVVAAAFHDHIFVPVDSSDLAMRILADLQAGAELRQRATLQRDPSSVHTGPVYE